MAKSAYVAPAISDLGSAVAATLGFPGGTLESMTTKVTVG